MKKTMWKVSWLSCAGLILGGGFLLGACGSSSEPGPGPGPGDNQGGTGASGNGSGGGDQNPGTGGGGGTVPGWTPGELAGFYPSTVTEEEVRVYYNSWKASWVEQCSDGTARVKFDDPNKTVSEGIGYGLLLAASWDDQALVDDLFAFYKKFSNSNGFMSWIVGPNGGPTACGGRAEDTGSATDADLDVAMALLIADCKWPDAGYGEEATRIISALKNLLLKNDNGHWFLCAGDNWGADCCGNASYQTPAYYRAFGQHTGDTAYWNKVADDSYYYLLKKSHPSTGLVADWMVPDSLQCSAKGEGDWHGWDASRVPWRVVTDYAWWGIEDAKMQSQKIASFVDSKGGILNTEAGHHTDGRGYGEEARATFAGAFASAGIAVSQEKSDAYFRDLKSVKTEQYFDHILRALYFTLAVEKFGYCGTE